MKDKEKYAEIKKSNGESRINVWISTKNYKYIEELMIKDLKTLKKSKGNIIDLALTNLFMSLESGESLEIIAINHLERIGEGT